MDLLIVGRKEFPRLRLVYLVLSFSEERTKSPGVDLMLTGLNALAFPACRALKNEVSGSTDLVVDSLLRLARPVLDCLVRSADNAIKQKVCTAVFSKLAEDRILVNEILNSQHRQVSTHHSSRQ